MDQLKQDHKKDEERYTERLQQIENNHTQEFKKLEEDYKGKLENSKNQKEG
jgi:rubrerythrin